VRLALDVCTIHGARVMELESYGVTVGCKADLLIVPGESVADAVVTRSPMRRVIKAGRIVARDGVSIRAVG
jgi:cytosine/creatinine deaminase